jgi:Peptidase family S41
MKQLLITPKEVIESGRRLAKAESIDKVIEKSEGIDSVFPLVFRGEKISEDVGLIRIYKFVEDSVPDIQIDQLVDEFRRLITKLPQKGLIIDVRGNGGGWIDFGERLLQFLTPSEITPEPYQLIASPLILDMTLSTSDPELKPWNSSLLESVTTGSIFSRGLPLTSRDEANDVGQIYHGPVILVTDAICYSTTDLFAAGFQDHRIGLVLGADTNTGAGGANVVNYSDIQKIAVGTKHKFEDLPSGSDMRVSLRRNVRVGEHAGTPVEDLGVTPDIMYSMTRRDLLERNIDLYKKASEILARMPVRQLDAVLSNKAGSLEINLFTLGISRIDIYVDGRPVFSQDVADGNSKLIVDKRGTSAKLVRIIGVKGNEIVAARKQFL